MSEKIIIFGAGEWGIYAYYYYRLKCEIIYYIDNSEELWGKRIHGIEVCSPDILKEFDLREIKIIIANKRRYNQILEQLNNQYGISKCILFKIDESVLEYVDFDENQNFAEECIIEYEGGLGNQMFQYALAKCLIVKGRFVTGDFSAYYHIGRRDFALMDVFSAVSIKECNTKLKWNYKMDPSFYIVEESIHSVDKKEANINILQKNKGYFEGYWQSYQYVNLVEEDLRKEFKFAYKNGDKLHKISNKILMENAVSIHIRRGDYLEKKAQQVFGDICTNDYYEKAIKYIKKNVSNPVFYFFSNDIKWVRENYEGLDAIYISKDMFDIYEDWYDMFLMSCCKHNIIANSTFSWWGAWLNTNKNKIVIAPSKWINNCEIIDIYPKEWIKI